MNIVVLSFLPLYSKVFKRLCQYAPGIPMPVLKIFLHTNPQSKSDKTFVFNNYINYLRPA